jgi:hypothetical protein
MHPEDHTHCADFIHDTFSNNALMSPHVLAESTRNFVVRALHETVTKGKEIPWSYVATKDISRASVDSFIKHHGLAPVVVASDKGTRTTVELNDLSSFTDYDAYNTMTSTSGLCGVTSRITTSLWLPQLCSSLLSATRPKLELRRPN